jgi:hypothetical protein
MPLDPGASACAFRFHKNSWLKLEREFIHCEAFFVEALEDRLLFHDSLRLVFVLVWMNFIPAKLALQEKLVRRSKKIPARGGNLVCFMFALRANYIRVLIFRAGTGWPT